MAQYLDDFRVGDTPTFKINYGKDTDITNWQFRLVILKTFGGKTALDITVTAGDHTDDVPTEGLVHLPITEAQSSSIKSGDYYYYVQRIIPGASNNIKTILPPVEDYKDRLKIREI